MKYAIVALSLCLFSCGSKGERGPAGLDGKNGLDGQDAQVETIELCPEIDGHGYVEYVLRIDGQLFGVYWQDGKSFLGRLNQGAYKTTDGRNCEFIVTEDLQVVQQ